MTNGNAITTSNAEQASAPKRSGIVDGQTCPRRDHRRRVTIVGRIIVCFFLGATTTVAVAWICAIWPEAWQTKTRVNRDMANYGPLSSTFVEITYDRSFARTHLPTGGFQSLGYPEGWPVAIDELELPSRIVRILKPGEPRNRSLSLHRLAFGLPFRSMEYIINFSERDVPKVSGAIGSEITRRIPTERHRELT